MLEITTISDGYGRSIIVRQNVSQLEDWRRESGYSLHLLRNTVLVLISIVMLICNECKNSNVELKVWLCGYTLQRAVHIVLVLLECKWWNPSVTNTEMFSSSRSNWRMVRVDCYGNSGITRGSTDIFRLRVSIHGYSLQFVVHVGMVWLEYRSRNRRISISESVPAGNGATNIRISTPIRRCRTWKKINMLTSEMWWVTGSIWLIFGSKSLLHVAPRLFWFTLAFLAIDVFFAAICFLLSVFLRFSVCFCFPCIVGFMYFLHCKEGASEADTSNIPQDRFEVSNDEVPYPAGTRIVATGPDCRDSSVEHLLLTEDMDCCICLCQYEHGEQLQILPCNHHFHSECIVKWLRVKATCPLCKIYHDD